MGSKTLQLVTTNTANELIGCTFLPVKRDSIAENMYWWKFDVPGKDFSDKLIEYRQDVESRFTGMSTSLGDGFSEPTYMTSSENQAR